jgi:hypothetical protein
LTAVLGIALGLRLWGVKQGLPFVYNTDEGTLFLGRAVGMFDHGLNPHYFENPPAFTYALHLLLAVFASGKGSVAHKYATDPTGLYVLARCFVAVLGTVAVWLLYLTGARLFRRAVGLLAAAVMAVAFLPVFYAHLALNDVPTLVPVTLALFGAAGVLKHGRLVDYAVAGLGLGLAIATKYTGGIVIVSIVAAGLIQGLRTSNRATAAGFAVAGTIVVVAFVAADPYSVLAFSEFWAGITHQSALSSEAQGKLGAPQDGGFIYYLWTLTWGLGWVPSLAALGGALTIWRDERRVGFVLVPTVVIFLAFMGLETRYFGRWMLPIFPIVCLLGAYFALQQLDLAATWFESRGLSIGRPLAAGLVTLVMCTQGLVYSIHSGLILSRPFTSELARRWMLAHVPAGSRVVVEPVVPNAWLEYLPGSAERATGKRALWLKLPALRQLVLPNGQVSPNPASELSVENYERTLRPALIPYYERLGYCWVLTGSTQSDRAFADPNAVPEAIAYYRALAAAGTVVYHVTPYIHGQVAFNFDWSFDYYPLAYHDPGPGITIYRLRGGSCSTAPPEQLQNVVAAPGFVKIWVAS